MRRAWLLWTAFALCLATGIGAMAWISWTVLDLDRAAADARRKAAIEENVRLALWRMDSALAPLIAQETARPYFHYSPFTPAQRAYTNMFNEYRFGEVLVPSPLLTFESPLILVHFQYGPDNAATSPQAPDERLRRIARRYVAEERIADRSAMVERVAAAVPADQLLALLPEAPTDDAAVLPQYVVGDNLLANANPGLSNPAYANSQAQAEFYPNDQQQQVKGVQELQRRQQNTAQAANYEINNRKNGVEMVGPRVREGVMRPLWVSGCLLLARRVTIDGRPHVQGCWMNWPEIRKTLLASIADLLPGASLEPASAGGMDADPRLLASLPVRLVPGDLSSILPANGSPVRFTLALAWGGVLLASAAVGALVWGAMRLSARRGAFVSAVTHELRTPLTTVSMYAEMLEEGMIRDERKRQEYLGTLRAEAERLGHLVENVLAYSRIERGRAGARLVDIDLETLVDGVRNRLATRAGQAGLELCVDLPPEAGSTSVRADPSAVEQILFNLVDNAAKYAAGAADNRLHIEAALNGRRASLRVRDHGPGINSEEARRLFRPFSKSAREAANSAPGVGLGLALSRRLARQMDGDLALEAPVPGAGAAFELSLPLSRG